MKATIALLGGIVILVCSPIAFSQDDNERQWRVDAQGNEHRSVHHDPAPSGNEKGSISVYSDGATVEGGDTSNMDNVSIDHMESDAPGDNWDEQE